MFRKNEKHFKQNSSTLTEYHSNKTSNEPLPVLIRKIKYFEIGDKIVVSLLYTMKFDVIDVQLDTSEKSG